MQMTTEQLTADTTFYALTATLPGYTLEDQIMGTLTLRECIWNYGGSDGEDRLVDELYADLRFFLSSKEAMIYKFANCVLGLPEPFTPASLLARLREMGEEANEE